MRTYFGITFKLIILMLLITGCTPYIYGVPQPQWDVMTASQREEAIRGYNERERLREIARQEYAVRQAREAEALAAETRRQEEQMQLRVAGIYAGTAGQNGDLIQVTISGGQMLVGWGHQNYQPIAFKIANGESRRIDVVAVTSYYVKPDHAELLVKYQDGMVMIDGSDTSWDRSARLLYDQTWRQGGSVIINTKNKLDLRNVKVGVKIIPHLKQVNVR